MTYWVYTVNRTPGDNISAVAVADIRVTLTGMDGDISYSENAATQKILCVPDNKNNQPLLWGSAIILVSGVPFWDARNDSDRSQLIAHLGKECGKIENISATALAHNLHRMVRFSGTCFLGIILYNANTKEISTCNIKVHPVVDSSSITLPVVIGSDKTGFKFEYQEASPNTKTFFGLAQNRAGEGMLIDPLTFRNGAENFVDKAKPTLCGVMRAYSSTISNPNSSPGNQGYVHRDTVSPSVDIAVMHSNGCIEVAYAMRDERAFLPTAYNMAPMPNISQGIPPENVEAESRLRAGQNCHRM